MDYATQDDMIARYGEQPLIELTDRATPPANAIDAGVLQASLDNTSSYIDSYIKTRYQLPLPTLPPALTNAATAITWFNLHNGRYTDQDRQAYEDANKFIKDISMGIARLDVAGAEPPSAEAQAVEQDSGRTFTKDKMKGF